jgi:hypothetical protein
MSATLSFDLFRPSILDRVEKPVVHPVPVALSGGPTLDELIVGRWDDLTAHRTTACPMCSAPMAPRYGAGPVPVGGRCTACATTLA